MNSKWTKGIPESSLMFHDRHVYDYGRCIVLHLPSSRIGAGVSPGLLPILFPRWIQAVIDPPAFKVLADHENEVILGNHTHGLEFRISLLKPEAAGLNLFVTLIVNATAFQGRWRLMALRMLIPLSGPGMQKRLDRLIDQCPVMRD